MAAVTRIFTPSASNVSYYGTLSGTTYTTQQTDSPDKYQMITNPVHNNAYRGIAYAAVINNTSSTDYSAIEATIYGQNADGLLVFEIITLPAPSSFVTSTKFYNNISNIIANTSISGTLSVGYGSQFVTPSIVFDHLRSRHEGRFQIDVPATNTMKYIVENTLMECDNQNLFNTPLEARWQEIDDNVVQSFGRSGSSCYSAYTHVPYAMRVRVTNYSPADSMLFTVVQSIGF